MFLTTNLREVKLSYLIPERGRHKLSNLATAVIGTFPKKLMGTLYDSDVIFTSFDDFYFFNFTDYHVPRNKYKKFRKFGMFPIIATNTAERFVSKYASPNGYFRATKSYIKPKGR
jgi:hypothetical protein